MAIDTLAKRHSAFIDNWGVVIPDGTLDASDRLTMLGQYSGIAAGGISNPIALTTFALRQPRTTYSIKTPATEFEMRRPRTTFEMEEV